MKIFDFPDSPFKIELSFDQVIERLRNEPSPSVSTVNLLNELDAIPQLNSGITDPRQILENANLIRSLLKDQFPKSLTNNEIKAVTIPYTSFFFNHSSRFSKILEDAGSKFSPNIRDFDDHQYYILSCCLILDSLYGTNLDFSRPLFYDIPGPDGLVRHYRILYNADFQRIIPTERAVDLTPQDLQDLQDNYSDLELWKKKFPLESFILRGFVIINLYDTTVENAVSLLKENLLDLTSNSFTTSFTTLFRSIFQIKDIEVGLVLYDSETDMFYKGPLPKEINSYLIKNNQSNSSKNCLCSSSYSTLFDRKDYFSESNTEKYEAIHSMNAHFFAQNILSYILAPVIKGNKLLGVLEVVSTNRNDLNSVKARKLEIVMPLVTNALERLIFQYQNQISAVIQENYTSIHKSVHWKFKNEAQQFIDSLNNNDDYQLKEIKLDGVYPLYGQVDIKGSTQIRIKCIQRDLQNQLNQILAIYSSYDLMEEPDTQVAEDRKKIKKFIREISQSFEVKTETSISYHLERITHPILKKIRTATNEPLILDYFNNILTRDGEYFKNRRKYETTIDLINKNLISVIDKGQVEAQRLFPHLYERYKTDGVDHTLYIGDSISPTSYRFENQYLKDLRFWQIRKTCEMVLAHEKLKSKLEFPLEVASLILVNHNSLDLRFRMDEKKFDVDGAYNAKFEIIKKRIDKALVKNSNSRITEVGKITIVCSNQYDIKEYLKYIKALNADNLLTEKTEVFDIEDLQDISGLVGLRAEIALK